MARCLDGPVTREWLVRDLSLLGVKPGMLLMVHCSLNALGYIAGGTQSLIPTLRSVIGESGTLVLPAFSWDNSEPSHWTRPSVPPEWVETIRSETEPYDPNSFICEPSIGKLPELFRTLPGVLRSSHPSLSWCAQGPLAEDVTRNHALALGMDNNSPLGCCYDLDAWVLSLGCRRTTVLHLAESRSAWAKRHLRMSGSRMLVDGESRWVEYRTVDDTDKDFEQCRLDYFAQADPADFAEGSTGYGTSRLLRVRPLVDFATAWFDAHRLDEA
jgi:aminoglycoside 3-N-acetyltransferase